MPVPADITIDSTPTSDGFALKEGPRIRSSGNCSSAAIISANARNSLSKVHKARISLYGEGNLRDRQHITMEVHTSGKGKMSEADPGRSAVRGDIRIQMEPGRCNRYISGEEAKWLRRFTLLRKSKG